MSAHASSGDEKGFLEQEIESIAVRRKKAFASSENPALVSEVNDVVGLSLSGGGLRSALFNDGFLQGLSHRGVLRYVDYLGSVSGGGYIASHLATREKTTNDFHNETQDPAGDQQSAGNDVVGKEATQNGTINQSSTPRRFLPWHLGRDPETGRIDPQRMPGIGQYLASPAQAFVSYAAGFIINMMVYLGLLGIVATIAAMFWRSFDNVEFRFLLTQVLQYRFGDELLIAFYPSILIFSAFLFAFVPSLICNVKLPASKWTRRLRIAANVLAVSFILSLLMSVAVFLGNGKTNISENATGTIHLNGFAQTLALMAGAIQILAFLGRDQLFRSEHEEATRWKKLTQQVATFSVVGIVMFAMLHWMAREDISNFTQLRSSYLVLGDVSDWRTTKGVFDGYPAPKKKITKKISLPELDPIRQLQDDDEVIVDPWRRHLLHGSMMNGLEKDLLGKRMMPPSPVAQEQEVRWSGGNIPRPPSGLLRLGKIAQAYACTHGADFLAGEYLKEMTKAYKDSRTSQLQVLNDWNEILDDRKFTEYLISLSTQNEPNGGAGGSPKNKTPLKAREDLERFTEKDLAGSALLDLMVKRDEDKFDRFQTAKLNRELIDALFPGAIQSPDIASTLVVPAHDQAARRQWLVLWMFVFVVGLVANQYGRYLPSVYRFYRERLRSFFHACPGFDHIQRPVEEGIKDPTRTGLPYPLILASLMRPTTRRGNYRVESSAFVFTPRYCGQTNDPSQQCETANVKTSRAVRPINLADAVTLSGAAVTPFMTSNRFLSVILSFFGIGLGRWLCWPNESELGKEEAEKTADAAFGRAIFWFVVSAGVVIAACVFWAEDQMKLPAALMLMSSAIGVWFLRSEHGVAATMVAMLVPRKRSTGMQVGHIADGGFVDYLGVTELLHRRCDLIIASDAGAHLNGDSLAPLARLCEQAKSEMGIEILDLDHQSPVDFRRLELSDSDRTVHQPFLMARIKYPQVSETKNEKMGLLVYCQMAISDSAPLEIQNVRNRFPSFPDEPTTNQFYTDDQVAAYRNLGYHIASRMSGEMYRWTAKEIAQSAAEKQPSGLSCQPLYPTMIERLKTSYRLACFQETSYSDDDIFSEAIWATPNPVAPSKGRVYQALGDALNNPDLLYRDALFVNADDEHGSECTAICDFWISLYEENADVRGLYRNAVTRIVNAIDDTSASGKPIEDADSNAYACVLEGLYQDLLTSLDTAAKSKPVGEPESNRTEIERRVQRKYALTCHLASIAVACHEIHEGRPSMVFQIGGRQKLISLMMRIAAQIETTLKHVSTDGLADSVISNSLKNIVSELMELKKCTFHGGELKTAISFAQCTVMLLGRTCRTELDRDHHAEDEFTSPTSTVKSIAPRGVLRTAVQRVAQQGGELALTKARIGLHEGLKENRASELIEALMNGFCIAFFTADELDASKPRRPRKKTTRQNEKTNAGSRNPKKG